MKTFRFFASFVAIAFLVNTNLVNAQNKTEKPKYNTWSATVNGGSMLFYGDLRQFDFYPASKQNSKDWYTFSKELTERQMGFGLAVTKQLTPFLGVQGFLQTGKLSGFKRTADAYFTANILAYGANAYLNISNLFNPNKTNHKFKLYGLIGVGYIDFKTKQQSATTDATLFSYGYGEFGQENKKTTELVIPIGLGVKYKINKRFDIGLESTMNNVNTDKLDAHVAKNTAKDKYGYTCLTLTYKIGKNEKSLDWVTPKDMESDELAPRFDSIKKKLDSLGNKLNDLDNKVNGIQKDVNNLKNPPVEADDDLDGVPNSKDLEPGTPKGNLVNFQGITIPKASSTGFMAQPDFSIFFAVNSTYIDTENEAKIAAAAKMLKDNADLNFEIVGHADKTGGQLYNQLLSEKRAKAVCDKLINSYGISASRLTITGKGFTVPLSSDVLGVNRRVDFIIKK
jgi:OmpA-OmpF porin, OOP family